MTKKTKRLTVKQSTFVDEYAENGGKGTQAALVAYDATRIDARNISAQNLQKPHILEAVNNKLKEIKDNMADKVTDLNLMNIALETTAEDLMSEDPVIRREARKFTLETYKFLDNDKVKKSESKHVHFSLPKWKG